MNGATPEVGVIEIEPFRFPQLASTTFPVKETAGEFVIALESISTQPRESVTVTV